MYAGTVSNNKLLLCSFMTLFFLQRHSGTLLIEVKFHSVYADLSQEFHLFLLYIIVSSIHFLTIINRMLPRNNCVFDGYLQLCSNVSSTVFQL